MEEEALYDAIPMVLKRAIDAILANPNYDESKQDRSFMAVHMKGQTCPAAATESASWLQPGAVNFCRGCQLKRAYLGPSLPPPPPLPAGQPPQRTEAVNPGC